MSTSDDRAADTGDEDPDTLAGQLVPNPDVTVSGLVEEDDHLGDSDDGDQIPDPQQPEEE